MSKQTTGVRRKAYGWIAFLAALAVVTGCSAPEPQEVARMLPGLDSATRVDDLRITLERLLKNDGVAHFRSRNGTWGGTDNDYDIKLYPDERSELIIFTYGIMNYTGSYSVNKSSSGSWSEVELKLSSPEGKIKRWPKMAAYMDQEELVLVRADGDYNAPIYASSRTNHHQSLLDENYVYWPFRQPVEESNGVLSKKSNEESNLHLRE